MMATAAKQPQILFETAAKILIHRENWTFYLINGFQNVNIRRLTKSEQRKRGGACDARRIIGVMLSRLPRRFLT